MGISLAPQPTDPNAPLTTRPNTTQAGTAAGAPLPTEYPNAPSTTGTPQNRLQLAQTAFNTFAASTAPQYTADLRQATQQAAGQGQEGSGQLRTTYGNLANQRALALDTERSNLINSATAATIGDQQTQQGLNIQQQQANTAQAGTLGNLSLATGEAVGNVNGQQTLAAKTAADQTAIARGQLAVQQGQLDLSKLSEADQVALQKAGLTGVLSDGTQTFAAKQAAIQNALAQGQLTNAQAQTAINALAQQSQATTAAGQLELAKQQLAQQGEQFGLSQAQQLQLAKLADATQNRQIDVQTQQGQNALLLQLAQIMGTAPNALDPNFVKQIESALGFNPGAPSPTDTGTTGRTTNTTNSTGAAPPPGSTISGYDANGFPIYTDVNGNPISSYSFGGGRHLTLAGG